MRLLTRIALPLALAATVAVPALAESDLPSSKPVISDLGNLTGAERTALRAEIRAYLLDNPEVILEAIDILEQRRTLATASADEQLVAANRKALLDDGYSYVGGNPDGDVTMVEFLDYRCGYCKKAHPEVKQVVESHPNLRYVVKEFPILGPDSLAAGRMALASLQVDGDKFSELHDQLMSFEGQLTEQVAYRIARDLGYDIAELKDLAASDEITEQVQRNYALAQALGIQGTPGFVIGDQVIRGYVPAEQLAEAIAEAQGAGTN